MNTPHTPSSLVKFSVGNRRFAVPLAAVERVVAEARMQPFSGVSAKILGLLNLGEPVPVLNLRRHLGLAEREVLPGDRFLLVRSARRRLALVAEEAERNGGGSEADDESLDDALVSREEGLYVLRDFDRILGADDEWALDEALIARG